MYGKLDSTSKHSVFEPLWKKNFGGMTWSKLWGGWHQIIGGDISPPSPPGICATAEQHVFTGHHGTRFKTVTNMTVFNNN